MAKKGLTMAENPNSINAMQIGWEEYIKEKAIKMLSPCVLNFLGVFDYMYIIKECKKEQGNCAYTKNAMYCYSDTLGWERIGTASPLVFDVIDCGFNDKGYYVIIDNTEGFEIPFGSVIQYWKGGEVVEEEIIGFEHLKHSLDSKVDDNRWSLITRNKVVEKDTKEIKVVLRD